MDWAARKNTSSWRVEVGEDEEGGRTGESGQKEKEEQNGEGGSEIIGNSSQQKTEEIKFVNSFTAGGAAVEGTENHTDTRPSRNITRTKQEKKNKITTRSSSPDTRMGPPPAEKERRRRRTGSQEGTEGQQGGAVYLPTGERTNACLTNRKKKKG